MRSRLSAWPSWKPPKDYEIDGASTLNTWVRNELRLSVKDAHALTRAAGTLAALPAVAEAAAGEIRTDHVAVFPPTR